MRNTTLILIFCAFAFFISPSNAFAGECTKSLKEVIVNQGAVTLKPSSSCSGYYYLAIDNDDDDNFPNEVLSIALAAYLSGKDVRIEYSDSSGDNPSGCGSGNCRLITRIRIKD